MFESSFFTTNFMPYTATGVATTYIAEGIHDDRINPNRDENESSETLKRVRNTLITSSVTTAAGFAHNVMYDHTISEAEALTQVEAQAYVDSMSDEELEQALTQVGLLEQEMSNSIDKTI